ncbi:MAG TPA: FAD-dependent monooxygenase [Fontimonas sp.]
MSARQPIVVAGSGPCGSVLALRLAQHGIPVIVLEKHPSLPRDLRASTFHPPSLEMLDELGIAQPMIRQGLVVDRYQYRDRRSGEVAEFRMDLIAGETAFPFRLQLEQYEMTHIANARLREFAHAQVLFQHEVVGAEQQGDSVAVAVRTPQGEKTFTTPFLIGADGAGSQVRKAAGIGFGGFTYDEKFLVVSTPFAFEDVFENLSYVNYVSDPQEWCVILRTEKIWRVLFPVFPKSAEEEAQVLSDAHIQARLQHLYAKDGAYEIGHRTLYKVHQRVSETYVKGRIALAGDACHINNPLGGMGMNGGIHDAHNLAGKLIEILRDGADPAARLAHYDRQRRELAVRFVQEHTINNKKLMESTDPDVQAKRQKMLMETAADPARAKAFVLERAMINCVRDSLAAA